MGRRYTGACTFMLALLAGVARADGGQSSRLPAAAVVAAVPYGANKVASGTFVHDGATLCSTIARCSSCSAADVARSDATRYAKLTENLLAMVNLASLRFWLCACASTV